jgi:SAM-dependent methyltransferase
VVEGIPVFSVSDDYVENYARISGDHVLSLESEGRNPFIPEDIWRDAEGSTRELIEKYSAKGARILDVGVGLGRLLSPLDGYSKFGIDISLDYLKAARSRGIEVCFSRIEDMPYRREAFDVVVCTDVLEHVIDLNLCCARILSVLKKGGVLVVRVPYKEDLGGYLDPGYPYRYSHLRSFDEHSIRILFEKIFRCSFLEWTTAGYREDRTRLRYRLPAGEKILMRLVSLARRCGDTRYRNLLRKAFFPIEFNAVIRKQA